MRTALERGQPLPPHHQQPLAVWQFGADLTFVALSGEVVSGYAAAVKRALGGGRLWVAGHSNEIDGYLPDATIVAEGGYEARGLVADIGFYSAEAEGVLVKAVSALATGTESIPLIRGPTTGWRLAICRRYGRPRGPGLRRSVPQPIGLTGQGQLQTVVLGPGAVRLVSGILSQAEMKPAGKPPAALRRRQAALGRSTCENVRCAGRPCTKAKIRRQNVLNTN
jgi:hypothetical protein